MIDWMPEASVFSGHYIDWTAHLEYMWDDHGRWWEQALLVGFSCSFSL
jgi:hypothetical protein